MRQLPLRLVADHSRTISGSRARDFFGIFDITNKDIAACFKSDTKLPTDQLREKYNPLQVSRRKLLNEHHEHNVKFGTMRFDRENVVKSHGQFEPSNSKVAYTPVDIKQKFPVETPSDDKPISSSLNQSNQDQEPEYGPTYTISSVNAEIPLNDVLELLTDKSIDELARYNNQPPLTFFFDGCQEDASSDNDTQIESSTSESRKLSGRTLERSEVDHTIEEALMMGAPKRELVHDISQEKTPVSEMDPDDVDFEAAYEESMKSFDNFNSALDEKYSFKTEGGGESMNALDYLKKIRSGKIQPTAKSLKGQMQNRGQYPFRPVINLDSKGFRVYSGQVPDWPNCRRAEVIQHIERSIIYNNYGVIAVNKPYGLASHRDQREMRNEINLDDIMQEIGKSMRLDKLHLVHRLDKNTTGVILLATSRDMAEKLSKSFRQGEVLKTYWCITRRVPKLEAAIIDIPIANLRVSNRIIRVVAPENFPPESQLSPSYRMAERALTEYRVLSRQALCALVEVKPKTGVTHQIRCHLGFGLGTPILGDHKYSDVTRLAPQTLPEPLLRQLHLRQSKVRTLPLHLHARRIVVPNVKPQGDNLFIEAPLPEHFSQNMKSLKLSAPP